MGQIDKTQCQGVEVSDVDLRVREVGPTGRDVRVEGAGEEVGLGQIDECLLGAGEIAAGDLRSVEGRPGQACLAQDRLVQRRAREVRTSKMRPADAHAGEIEAGQIASVAARRGDEDRQRRAALDRSGVPPDRSSVQAGRFGHRDAWSLRSWHRSGELRRCCDRPSPMQLPRIGGRSDSSRPRGQACRGRRRSLARCSCSSRTPRLHPRPARSGRSPDLQRTRSGTGPARSGQGGSGACCPI